MSAQTRYHQSTDLHSAHLLLVGLEESGLLIGDFGWLGRLLCLGRLGPRRLFGRSDGRGGRAGRGLRLGLEALGSGAQIGLVLVKGVVFRGLCGSNLA